MPKPVVFYRYSGDQSLPSIEDGAVYVLPSERMGDLGPDGEHITYYYGDMFVDISPTERLHIKPKDGVYYSSSEELANDVKISVKGKPYFVMQTNDYPTMVIGDGTHYIKDLQPVYQLVSEKEKKAWNDMLVLTPIEDTNNEFRFVFSKLSDRKE